MELKEMKERKRALGYTNKMLADLSGVPLGTVQKVMSGASKAPTSAHQLIAGMVYTALMNHHINHLDDKKHCMPASRSTG